MITLTFKIHKISLFHENIFSSLTMEQANNKSWTFSVYSVEHLYEWWYYTLCSSNVYSASLLYIWLWNRKYNKEKRFSKSFPQMYNSWMKLKVMDSIHYSNSVPYTSMLWNLICSDCEKCFDQRLNITKVTLHTAIDSFRKVLTRRLRFVWRLNWKSLNCSATCFMPIITEVLMVMLHFEGLIKYSNDRNCCVEKM